MPLLRAPLFFAVASLLLVATAASARTLKIATIAPEGSAWMQEMRQVGEEIAERTDGRVKLKFYPSGIMGSDKTVLRKIRAGQLQGGAFTAGALAPVFPDVILYGIPLLFRSYAEVDYVRARMDDQVIAGLEQAGFATLAITDGGFAYMMSQKPLRTVEDLRGGKVWMEEGDEMSDTAFGVAGVSAIQLPLADVYTALQTGLIDTIAAPAMGAIALQWHTKVKYLTDLPLSYLTGIFAIDRKVFAKLSPEDQQVLREAVSTTARELDAGSRQGEENARRALQTQGIEFITPDRAEGVEHWDDLMRRSLAKIREKHVWSDAMIDELLAHLAEFRSQAREERGD
jgi:TRAP-type C4-dicarboxylate transport system substrate-binding protein